MSGNRRRRRRWWAPAAAALALVFARCSASAPGTPRSSAREARLERTVVGVAIAPYAWMVRSIGGDRVAVETLVPAGQDPHTYDLRPAQLARLAQARLYFASGLDIERTLLPKIARSFPAIRVVDTLAGLPLIRGQEGEPRGTPDPHTWLSPSLALRQSLTIRDALIEADPEGRAAYEQGFARLAGQLEDLRERVGRLLAPHRGARFYVFHPSWGYFAREFGLEQVAIEVEGKEPTARELAELVGRARRDRVRVVFAQPQASSAAAANLAREIGARVVLLDPLAERYVDELDRASREIAAALAIGSPSP